MKKRFFSVILTLCMLLALLPTLGFEAEASTQNVKLSDGYVAHPVEGGSIYFNKETGMVVECDSLVTFAVIPDEIDGVAVKSIGYYAFAFCDKLTDVLLPDSLTSIGGYAFWRASSLTSVTIPNGVTSIGEYAFYGCSALTGIWVDESNPNYSSDSFGILFNKEKTELLQAPDRLYGEYAVPDSVTSIAPYSFEHCSILSSVTLPAGVTSIGESAFENCVNLKSVFFLGDAPELGEHVFQSRNGETEETENIEGLALYYVEGKDGWTAPTWNGYPTETWIPSVEPTEPTKPEEIPSSNFKDVAKNAWYKESVDYAVAKGLMNGMGNNTFEPDTATNRAMLVTILWRYAGSPVDGTNSFKDVANGQWFTQAVAWAAKNEIVSGMGNNKFDPEGKLTREQLATILFRYAKLCEIDTSARAKFSKFEDGKKVQSWSKEAVQWAVAEGIIGGTSENGKLYLDPQGNATRAQVATILMRFIEKVLK